MTFDPVLLILLVVLLGLLPLSVGYRRRFNARRPMQSIVAAYRDMAQENARRYAPGLALNLKLLAVEHAEAGELSRALLTIMESADLYRALAQEQPGRYRPALDEVLALEEAIKKAAGLKPDADLRAVIARLEAEEKEKAMAEAQARKHSKPARPFAVFYWQVALTIWCLSVSILLWVGYFKPLFFPG